MADRDSSAMDFTLLAEAQSQEKGSSALTKLPEGFFERAVSFIKASYADIENRLSEGGIPGKDAIRLTSENQRARETLEALYSSRERKVVLAALNAARGIDQRTENMTDHEKDLFFNLKVELENKRDRALRYDRMMSRPATLRKETGIDTSTDDFAMEGRIQALARKAAQAAAPECVPPRKIQAEAQMNGTPAEMPQGNCLKGYALVRALKEVGPFACGDGISVVMARNDIATLPEQIASILVEQGYVRLLEGGT